MTTYEKCQMIRKLIVNRASEGLVYKEHWGQDFRIEQIDEIPKVVEAWEARSPETGSWKIQPADLTLKEMEELGFGLFSHGLTSRLIPLWLYPFLADEIYVECIDGEKSTMRKSEMDTDSRYGLLAYGVVPKLESSDKEILKPVPNEEEV